MTDENYHKCRTCRYCRHQEDSWYCRIEKHPTDHYSSCDRYRPGCCENCNMFSDDVCKRTGEERFSLDVCVFYDPAGSV